MSDAPVLFELQNRRVFARVTGNGGGPPSYGVWRARLRGLTVGRADLDLTRSEKTLPDGWGRQSPTQFSCSGKS
jgi:hypothetical protein